MHYSTVQYCMMTVFRESLVRQNPAFRFSQSSGGCGYAPRRVGDPKPSFIFHTCV